MKTKKRKTNKTVYDIVTEQIITKLEAGTVPWRKPWKNGGAIRWSVNEPYRGINTILLEPGEYASKKQIEAAGGKIKKEEFGNYYICVYWLWKKFKEEDEDGEEHTKRFAKPFYYKVWKSIINAPAYRVSEKRLHSIMIPSRKPTEYIKGIRSRNISFKHRKQPIHHFLIALAVRR